MQRSTVPEASKGFYVTHWFATREDAEVFQKLAEGLASAPSQLRSAQSHTPAHETRLGRIILAFFVLPNRSYHSDDIKAHAQEHGYSHNTVGSYLPELVRSGHLKVLGPQTYVRKYDPTTSVRADIDLEASGHDLLAGLVTGETCGCGCGDQG